MNIARLVAVGLGLAIYVGGTILVRRLIRRKKTRAKHEVTSPAVEKPKAKETAAEEPIETERPVEHDAAVDRPAKAAFEKDVLSAAAIGEAKVKKRPAVKPEAPSRARPSPPSTPEMHWFLIKPKTGPVRVVQAKGKTPKTVAGPFPTKEDAHRARELELARPSVAPKPTGRRPKGKASRAAR